MLESVRRLHKGSVSTLQAPELAPGILELRTSHEGTLAFLAPHSFGASSTFEPVPPSFDYVHCEPGTRVEPRLREIVATPYGRPTLSLVTVDPDLPNAHRVELPQHERRISAESLRLLREGAEDVRAGRTRKLDLEDLNIADDE